MNQKVSQFNQHLVNLFARYGELIVKSEQITKEIEDIHSKIKGLQESQPIINHIENSLKEQSND